MLNIFFNRVHKTKNTFSLGSTARNSDIKKKKKTFTNLSGIIFQSSRTNLHRMKYSIPNEAEFYNFQSRQKLVF